MSTMNDENCYGNARAAPQSASSKASLSAGSKGPAKARSSTFSNLLKDATNQVRVEYDEKVAVDYTVNEAIHIMDDWCRENKDLTLAKEMAEKEEREEVARKAAVKSAVAQGEAAALKVAIDETRRIKAEAKARDSRMAQDSDMAKSMYEADEKEAFESSKSNMQRAHEDEKLARQLSMQADDKDSKDCDSDDDKNSDDEKSCGDYKEDVEEKEEGEDEEALVREVSQKFQQLDADERAAQDAQRQLHEQQKTEDEQSKKDFELSRRMAVKTEREAHRSYKYKEMQQSFQRCQRGAKAVAELWENAEAEVDDVCEAVCITLLLPNIINLSVKVIKSGRKVAIDAHRLTNEGDKFATAENTSYLAHFAIQGKNVKVADNCVSHDYSSDTGLLHIYISGVALHQNSEGESGNFEYADAFGKGEGDCRRASKAGAIANAMKSGFMRLIGK